MVEIANIAINWLLISALYALIAVGFTLIFGVGGVLNLFHGGSILVGAFTAYYLGTQGFSPLVGLVAAIGLTVAINYVLYRFTISKVENKPIVVMILTLLFAVLAEEVVLEVFGDTAKIVGKVVPGFINIAGIQLQSNRVLLFALSWVLIGAFLFLINRTYIGRAIIATSMSKRGAILSGVDTKRVNTSVWMLAGGLAGTAGVFTASFQTAAYNMWLDPLVISFSIVVIGGLGSIKGSIIGAYLIGGIETVTTTLIDPRLRGLGALILLIIVLMVKPQGLFGHAEVEAE